MFVSSYMWNKNKDFTIERQVKRDYSEEIKSFSCEAHCVKQYSIVMWKLRWAN